MRKEKQRQILALVQAGYDAEVACVRAGLKPNALERASKRFLRELAETRRTATAMLRGKALEYALESKDAGLIAKITAEREAAEGRRTRRLDDMTEDELLDLLGGEPDPDELAAVQEIHRVIVPAICENCGQPAIKRGDVKPFGPRPVEPEPEPEATAEPEPEPPGRPRYRRIYPDTLERIS